MIPQLLVGRYHDRVQMLYHSDEVGYMIVLAPSGHSHRKVAQTLRIRRSK
jgi:hypothetical protein